MKNNERDSLLKILEEESEDPKDRDFLETLVVLGMMVLFVTGMFFVQSCHNFGSFLLGE